MPIVPAITAMALMLFADCATAASPAMAAETDLLAAQRITREVPGLLAPASSILRITVAPYRSKQQEARSISDPGTIAKVPDALRNAIQTDQFQIGHQFHSPKEELLVATSWSAFQRMLWMLYNPSLERS